MSDAGAIGFERFDARVSRRSPVGRQTERPGRRPETINALPPRRAYVGPALGWLGTPIIPRAALATLHEGPCIVEEYDATCVIPPGARAALDPLGNILIEL